MLDDFMALSEALTGVHSLDRSQAQDNLNRVMADIDVGPSLAQLLAVFKDIQAAGGDIEAAI